MSRSSKKMVALKYKNKRDPEEQRQRAEAVLRMMQEGETEPHPMTRRMHVSHHSMKILMRELMRRGLVVRRRHPRGLDNFTYHLTDKGQKCKNLAP